MQFTTIVTALALSTMASAWSLAVTGADGRRATFSGRLDSGCNDISFTPAINVRRALFNPATTALPDPTTFELYVNTGCRGLSYRNGPGDWTLTPARVIRSYKVY